MKQFKINLIDSAGRGQILPKHAIKPWPIMIMLVIFVLSFGVGRLTYSAVKPDTGSPLKDALSFFVGVGKLIISPDKKLIGEDSDRINILMLGMGGENHDGPLLTDTIIVASIKPSQNKVALLSIPRDLLVPMSNQGWRKINAVNALGEKTPGAGLEVARTTVEGLLGIDIPYAIRVDFNGFESFIDSLDGLDIYVEKAFTDYEYPTNNYKYQTISFKQGWQKLNGDMALKFVRSRHGNNGEGSDFARSRRQQKILSALKDKILTVNMLKNPSMVKNVLSVLQSNITTNLQFGEIASLAKIGQIIDRENISSVVLDDSPSSFLRSGYYNNAYVLMPRNNDWSLIRNLALNIFDNVPNRKISTPLEPSKTGVIAQNTKRAKVEIQNGTTSSGKAKLLASKLANIGFDVVKIGNATKTNYQETTIYVLDDSQKSSVTKIQNIFPEATVINRPSNQVLNNLGINNSSSNPNTPDLLVILGQDQTSL